MYSITYYNNVTSLTAHYCWEADDHWALYLSVYQLLLLFLLPALLMLLCYFCVIRELWASTKVITTLTQPLTTAAGQSGVRVHKDGHSYLVRWPSKRLTSAISCPATGSCHSASSGQSQEASSSTGGHKCRAQVIGHQSFDLMHVTHDSLHAPPPRSPVTDIRNARKQVLLCI